MCSYTDKIPWAFFSPGCSVLTLSLSSYEQRLQSPKHLSSPSSDSPQYILISFVQGSPKLDQSLHMSHLHWVEGTTHHFRSAGSTAPDVPVCLGHCWFMGSPLPPGPPGPILQSCSPVCGPMVCIGAWSFSSPRAGLLNCMRFPSAHFFTVSRSLWIAVQAYCLPTTPPSFVSSCKHHPGHQWRC